MKRREFIQCMLPVAGFPLVFPMWSVAKTLGGPSELQRFLDTPEDGRVLVLVQLAGGNDGLNTVIPHSDDLYYNARPNLAIPADQVIDLNGDLGLHPRLASLRPLFDDGRLAIVQGVGYPNPDRSHFKSTDIWLTASDSDDLQDTGWLGRYFDAIAPPDDEGNTNTESLGPPAIQIGLTSSLALLGKNPKGIALTDPLAFYNLVNRQGDSHGSDPSPEPQTPAERELAFLRSTAAAAFEYAEDIRVAAEKSTNTIEYPNESLAQQLAIVAKLIAGGLTTRVYIVSIKGFDTHASQISRHEALLEALGNAIASFQQDIDNLGVADRVVGMVFSEFGRRIRENASLGTDHGTAAPMFFFGNAVRGGFHGPHPSLSDTLGGDLKHIHDFRQLYATVLEQWFNFDSQQVLGTSFPTIGLLDTTTSVRNTPSAPVQWFLSPNFPNPFNPRTSLRYGLPESSEIDIAVFNMLGREVASLYCGRQSAGQHTITWDADGHPSGVYIIQLRAQGVKLTRTVQLVK